MENSNARGLGIRRSLRRGWQPTSCRCQKNEIRTWKEEVMTGPEIYVIGQVDGSPPRVDARKMRSEPGRRRS
ncbi:histone deacetylase [Musa troglodytarum]|uniref:Histone deacetylase n=1 Tax=Musa troglodytarum TaxID=320322 RepID=A0A9E7K1Y5_9LILI|nr:histone deacetylase [Musa troglodytarum]